MTEHQSHLHPHISGHSGHFDMLHTSSAAFSSSFILPYGDQHSFDLSIIHTQLMGQLIRLRLSQEKWRGLVTCMIFLGGAGVLGGVAAYWSFAPIIALCVSCALSLALGASFLADALLWRIFRRWCAAYFIPESLSRRLFERAIQAEHWVHLLRSCNAEPTDTELAHFVLPHPPAPSASPIGLSS